MDRMQFLHRAYAISGDLGTYALGVSHGPIGLAATESDDNVPRGTILKILPLELEPLHEMKR
jgi:hypothetical protein